MELLVVVGFVSFVVFGDFSVQLRRGIHDNAVCVGEGVAFSGSRSRPGMWGACAGRELPFRNRRRSKCAGHFPMEEVLSVTE